MKLTQILVAAALASALSCSSLPEGKRPAEPVVRGSFANVEILSVFDGGSAEGARLLRLDPLYGKPGQRWLGVDLVMSVSGPSITHNLADTILLARGRAVPQDTSAAKFFDGPLRYEHIPPFAGLKEFIPWLTGNSPHYFKVPRHERIERRIYFVVDEGFEPGSLVFPELAKEKRDPKTRRTLPIPLETAVVVKLD